MKNHKIRKSSREVS